jgi:hypothetical protein
MHCKADSAMHTLKEGMLRVHASHCRPLWDINPGIIMRMLFQLHSPSPGMQQ